MGLENLFAIVFVAVVAVFIFKGSIWCPKGYSYTVERFGKFNAHP